MAVVTDGSAVLGLGDIGPEAVDVSLRAGSISASLDPIKATLGVKAPPDLFVALAAADLALDWKSLSWPLHKPANVSPIQM